VSSWQLLDLNISNIYLERGSSGAWVVQGPCLLGIIIAVYDDEPYAHMLDIASVFQDVRALLSDGEHIPSVLVAGNLALESSPDDDVSSVDEPLIYPNNAVSLRTSESPEESVSSSREANPKTPWYKQYLSMFSGKTPPPASLQSEKQYTGMSDQPRIDSNSVKNKFILSGIVLAYFCVHLVSGLPSFVTHIAELSLRTSPYFHS
jgi:hypothetical protein